MSEKDKNKDENNFLGDENRQGNFGTPENYFDSFSARLFSKLKADDELKDYPLLSAAGKVNPFAVPANYFMAKEELAAYPYLHSLKQNSFAAPAAYFEVLPARVNNTIVLQEELQPYATLQTIEKEKVFALPANYFDGFYASLRAVIAPTRVVPLYGRVLKKYRFAAAAAALLFVTLTIVLLNRRESPKGATGGCTTLACLSKKEILNSGVLQNMNEESIIEMIDEKALNDSLLIGKDGKKEKISAEDVSEEIDVNTLTEEL